MRPVNRHIQNSLNNRLYYLSKPHPNMTKKCKVYRKMWSGCRTVKNYGWQIKLTYKVEVGYMEELHGWF